MGHIVIELVRTVSSVYHIVIKEAHGKSTPAPCPAPIISPSRHLAPTQPHSVSRVTPILSRLHACKWKCRRTSMLMRLLWPPQKPPGDYADRFARANGESATLARPSARGLSASPWAGSSCAKMRLCPPPPHAPPPSICSFSACSPSRLQAPATCFRSPMLFALDSPADFTPRSRRLSP